jgi:hypothetical protein
MARDIRTYYIWILLFYFNIFVFLGCFLTNPSQNISRGAYDSYGNLCSDKICYLKYIFFDGSNILTYIPLFVSIILSIIAVLLAKLTFKWKNYIGYGLPIIVLLLAAVYYYSGTRPCSGMLCGLNDMLMALFLGMPAFVFLIFFIISTYFRKWNSKIVLILFLILSFIILYSIYSQSISFLSDFNHQYPPLYR